MLKAMAKLLQWQLLHSELTVNSHLQITGETPALRWENSAYVCLTCCNQWVFIPQLRRNEILWWCARSGCKGKAPRTVAVGEKAEQKQRKCQERDKRKSRISYSNPALDGDKGNKLTSMGGPDHHPVHPAILALKWWNSLSPGHFLLKHGRKVILP